MASTGLLSSCGDDPMGPDNRLALIALTQCQYDKAEQLTDNAAAQGNADNTYRAWVMKAAILRDRGDAAGAEALYPRIESAWEAAKERTLTAYRRERDIGMIADIVRAERLARNRPEDCTDLPPPPVEEAEE
jgi:hypothetical protein